MNGETEQDKLLRWQCRRGMLELDLVLAQLLDRYQGRLTPEDKSALLELLEWPDNDLWDLILGRSQSDNKRFEAVLALLRTV